MMEMCWWTIMSSNQSQVCYIFSSSRCSSAGEVELLMFTVNFKPYMSLREAKQRCSDKNIVLIKVKE